MPRLRQGRGGRRQTGIVGLRRRLRNEVLSQRSEILDPPYIRQIAERAIILCLHKMWPCLEQTRSSRTPGLAASQFWIIGSAFDSLSQYLGIWDRASWLWVVKCECSPKVVGIRQSNSCGRAQSTKCGEIWRCGCSQLENWCGGARSS